MSVFGAIIDHMLGLDREFPTVTACTCGETRFVDHEPRYWCLRGPGGDLEIHRAAGPCQQITDGGEYAPLRRGGPPAHWPK